MAVDLDQAKSILEENFADWVRDLSPRITEATDDGIIMEIPFSQRLCRIGGIMCGQAIISAADTAMVIALASANGGMRAMTTIDLTCNFMRPVIDEDAVLEAKVERAGRSIAFCTTRVTGHRANKLSAFVTGTYALID